MSDSNGKAKVKRPLLQRLVSGAFMLVFGFILPVAVIVAGFLFARHLIETGPKAQRKPAQKQARLVEARPLYEQSRTIVVEAMGTVKPSRMVNLQPEVSGRVIELGKDYIPGGVFTEGETILKIDPRDYELEVKQAQAAVAKAESALRIEIGQQEIAKQEFDLLGQTVSEEDAEWVLRKPQLEAAQADLDAAKLSLELARLNQERTEVKAPFDSIIIDRGVELGMQVSSSTTLADLAGTNEYWVELLVPVSDLRWIIIPKKPGEKGSLVRIYDEVAWGRERFREGHIIRMEGEVDPESRMARLIVSVNDPVALLPENADKPALLLNSYVRGEIEGVDVENSFVIAREYIHDGDNVWIMTPEGTLEIRPVPVLYRGRLEVIVSEKIEHGEILVTSNIGAPVDGMSIRTNKSAVEEDAPGAVEPKGDKEVAKGGQEEVGQ